MTSYMSVYMSLSAVDNKPKSFKLFKYYFFFSMSAMSWRDVLSVQQCHLPNRLL